MRRLSCLVLLLAACKPGRGYDPVVESLGRLPATAGAEEFLRRPGMEELVSAMDDALPALNRGLKSPDGAVRASSLYVLFSNGLHPLTDFEAILATDTEPRVRFLLGQSRSNGPYAPPADLQATASRMPGWKPRGQAVHWLPPALQARRIDRAMELIRASRPVVGFDESRFNSRGPEYAPLSRAGVDVLYEALQGPDPAVHGVIDRLLEEFRGVPAEQPGRVALLLDVAYGVLNHAEPYVPGQDPPPCPRMGELTGLLLGFARKHLTGCRDENVLCHGIQLLHDLALRDVQGLDLLKDLSANLPTPEGRDRAASWLKMAQSSRASWEKGR